MEAGARHGVTGKANKQGPGRHDPALVAFACVRPGVTLTPVPTLAPLQVSVFARPEGAGLK